MSIHDDARAASEAVYDRELDRYQTLLSIADAELESLRTDKNSLVAEQEHLLLRIKELEARIKELETPPPVDPGVLPEWGAPVWRDEFDGDLSKWNVRHNALTFDTAKNMRENVTIENGSLHIRAKWLATPLKEGKQGIVTHTSGYIDTIGKFSQQYGRWEIRCKMPAGANTRGALSAFWLRNALSGEIDAIERWGQGGVMTKDYEPYVANTGWTTFHSNTEGSSQPDYIKTFWRHYQHGIPKDAEDTMHTYAFEYMPDYTATYVDGKLVKRVTPDMPDPENPPTKKRANGTLVNPSGTYAWCWDPKYFGAPFNMRLNLHVGPGKDYWGNPDPANRALTKDPLDYEVEYVRVYAPKG